MEEYYVTGNGWWCTPPARTPPHTRDTCLSYEAALTTTAAAAAGVVSYEAYVSHAALGTIVIGLQ